MKYSIDNLVIEITRKCNMKCRHCLRGPARNINITQDMINKIVSQFEYIDVITFGGGEPSLFPEAIEWFNEAIRMYNVSVGNFYVVTNGKKYSQRLYDACYNLYKLCEQNELSGFCISDDEFHRECISDRNKWLYNKAKYSAYPYYYTDYIYDETIDEEMYYNTISEDDYLPYFRERDKSHNDGDFYGIIKMGNAEKNGIWHRTLDVYYPKIDMDYIKYDGTIHICDGELYVAYNGDVFADCDLSYNVMNKGFYKVGNIENFKAIIKELQKHNND